MIWIFIVLGVIVSVIIAAVYVVIIALVRRNTELLYQINRDSEMIWDMQDVIDRKDRELEAAHANLEMVLTTESKELQDMNAALELVLNG